MRELTIIGVWCVALMSGAVGCGSGTTADPGSGLRTTYPLPMGLRQVDGTEAIAPPVVIEPADGDPRTTTSLRAAYRVNGVPDVAMTAWSDQLAELGIGPLMVSTPSMHESDAPMPWLELLAVGSGTPISSATAELWSTADDPLLLIEIDLAADLVSVHVEPPDLPDLSTMPPPFHATVATEGGPLFGGRPGGVRLPSGAEQVMPGVPSLSGTDGEVVMLRTDDPMATVRALV